jgi:hypothetical protein
MATSFSLSPSLLLVCFCCFLSVSVSQVLPGVDNRPNAYNGVCMQESNEILTVPAIRNELARLHSEVAQIEVMEFCTLQDNPNIAGDRYECRLDFNEFGFAFKTACSQNEGTFQEQNLRVHCLGRGETGPPPAYSWEFVNFPMCTGADCNAADVERWLTRSVLQTEAALQFHLNHALCKADPNMEFRGSNIHSFITEQEEQVGNVLEQAAGSESQQGGSNQMDSSDKESESKAPSSPVAAASMIGFGLALLL